MIEIPTAAKHKKDLGHKSSLKTRARYFDKNDFGITDKCPKSTEIRCRSLTLSAKNKPIINKERVLYGDGYLYIQ
jgi:hypothetical protein